ncbi:MAG: hypothetical protein IJ542_02405 [Clostridia bacterium]|nr:hypothetical protein [Clostridia bacterium]
MKKFKIVSSKRQSVVRSIRFDAVLFERLVVASRASGISFNKLISKCAEYALENM